jgi:hypothetical protein
MKEYVESKNKCTKVRSKIKNILRNVRAKTKVVMPEGIVKLYYIFAQKFNKSV